MNSVPNNNIFDQTKLKEFADNIFNLSIMIIYAFDRVKKHGGKRRKCCLPPISPFHTIFSKYFSLKVCEIQNCAVKWWSIIS